MENLNAHLEKVRKRIRLARLERGYNQSYVASKMSLTQNAYSKLELGHSQVTLKKLYQLSEILKVDVEVLIRM